MIVRYTSMTMSIVLPNFYLPHSFDSLTQTYLNAKPLEPNSQPHILYKTLSLSLSLRNHEQAHLVLLPLLALPLLTFAECSCETQPEERNKTKALKFKLVAISTILIGNSKWTWRVTPNHRQKDPNFKP